MAIGYAPGGRPRGFLHMQAVRQQGFGIRLDIATGFLDQRARDALDSTNDGDRRRLHEETVYGAVRGF
ncbi:hypothetical protein LJ656_01525 [Paraburkholderia sp. MMS20-SJTR3]|uniref:Uncharacterized protein n=1 Tax=Paraburkholderia sejongensis TaxID=2886946 RepID=A0ABS8JNB5_9BURK|nr:hypothetical protein [Paraburkholderia sp. MMS20-SJTR3]MCC8391254.1 hypothetical protein [Paraburkholderia sp. MMS20-SJTR3]